LFRTDEFTGHRKPVPSPPGAEIAGGGEGERTGQFDAGQQQQQCGGRSNGFGGEIG
jgi:hypothetical protein